MGTLLIRRLDDSLKRQLRRRAAENGRSMEEEARSILRQELSSAAANVDAKSLADIAREIFGPRRGVDLEPHPWVPAREPPDFGR